uniref:NADH dehydrogenase subunit 2 n=1 Tax=Tracheophilus cymbius TaxID=2502951 RepID=A0A516IAD1_9TREM|nr:NADH dehydrogenase subunit 2 [Tracheophilus cymbius]QDP13013.1 NADH dehydrogenase subunit 2 [Tracheophilus cymbius]
MRGVVLLFLSLLGLVVFSSLLFFSNSLSFFWLFLELSGLCVVPCFFLLGGGSCVFSGLFSYIVVSSISSSLILCGLLEELLLFLLLFGFFIKFGLFPFLGWVYSVGLNSNWIVLWALSTFLKVPIFCFPFFLNSGGFFLVDVLSCLSFLVLSFLFWVYSYSWFHCWCHMMLSSSVCLVVMSGVLSSDVLFYVFFVYLIWASMVICFFYSMGCDGSSGLSGVSAYFFFVVLLVSVPFSFSIFYKILMAVSMLSCSLLVLFFWAVYCVSEQFYLLKFLVSCFLPKSEVGVFSGI